MAPAWCFSCCLKLFWNRDVYEGLPRGSLRVVFWVFAKWLRMEVQIRARPGRASCIHLTEH